MLCPSPTGLLVLFTVGALCFLFQAVIHAPHRLSPQGCRMSRMSPSYIQQVKFNDSWTPLARRYSLWLYQEVGWESQELGVPAIFIPGNAGSSRQVRSIASSAARQYYSSPYTVDYELSGRGLRPLDVFAVEFNEDLSAFHGPTLESQITYTSRAIDYILTLYPAGTPIIVMGHSMGGVVAVSLLPSPDIAAIITMSTPHTLPPARFDHRIDAIYDRNLKILASDSTPVISLCGGATDMMIPSESCVLPLPETPAFRRTIFSSSLDGAWTGVGHREMVWCHQVRWRVARAALELTSPLVLDRGMVLDRWLSDGQSLSASGSINDLIPVSGEYKEALMNEDLFLKGSRSSGIYLLPIVGEGSLTVLVSGGSIHSLSPIKSSALRVSVFSCAVSSACSPITPTAKQLLPSPQEGKPFPLPDAGSDESEGVVLFEASSSSLKEKFVALKIEDAGDHGWVLASTRQVEHIVNEFTLLDLVFRGPASLSSNSTSLHKIFELPNLFCHTLIVYRLEPEPTKEVFHEKCPAPTFSPLIKYTSQVSETHYFPLRQAHVKPILLHNHAAVPYVQLPRGAQGLKLDVYSSNEECDSKISFKINIDWPSTFARCAIRYFTTVAAWAVGIICIIMFDAWSSAEANNASMTSVETSLSRLCSTILPRFLILFFIAGVLPFPVTLFLGVGGDIHFTLLSPLIFCVSGGLVCISAGILGITLKIIGRVKAFGPRQDIKPRRRTRSIILSLSLICLSIFLFIPWQVAFLGCWFYQLWTCAGNTPGQKQSEDTLNHNRHLLLLMTWLLPFVAPVLVVWIRTLMTAGIKSPFESDHFFLRVAPFLILVDFASWSPQLFEKHRYERHLSIRWSFMLIGVLSFFIGPRKPYIIFDVTTLVIAAIVIVRIGPRYWHRSWGYW